MSKNKTKQNKTDTFNSRFGMDEPGSKTLQIVDTVDACFYEMQSTVKSL